MLNSPKALTLYPNYYGVDDLIVVTLPYKYRITAAGFTAITGQVILLRLLEVQFGGSEIALGLYLASWLLWSGLGAGTAKFYARKRLFPLFLSLQALTLPLSVWMFRALPALTGRQVGVLAGLSDVISGGVLLIAPFAYITGALFTLAIAAAEAPPRKIYFWEAVGAVAGGAFVAATLGRLDYFQIGFVMVGVNLLAAFAKRSWQLALAAACVIPAILWLAPPLDKVSVNLRWRGYRIIRHDESIYGDIAALKVNEQYALYQNGMLAASRPDPAAAEEAVHFAALAHPKPQRVFLMGGGLSGAVDELLKHPSITAVDYAEIDRQLIRTMVESFPPEASDFTCNPSVRIVNLDGRAWLKPVDARYDLIIIDLPEPVTAQLNRYYTLEFFQDAARNLKPGGIFAFNLNSSEDFIDPELADFLAGIKRTLDTAFPHTYLLPGNMCHFLASDSSFTTEADILMRRIEERGIQTAFISPYYLPYRLSPERKRFLTESLESSDSGWINRDFRPLGYFRALARWSSQFRPGSGNIFEILWRLPHWIMLPFLIMAMALLLFLLRGSLRQRGLKLAVAAGGFTQIGMQIALILGFQSIYGYMYYQQALLIAAFMAGAAVGSGCVRERWVKLSCFLKLQAAVCLVPLAVYGLLVLTRAIGGAGGNLLTLGALLCGALGGAQYSLAAGLVKGPSPQSRGGGLYAIDLFGSAAGALLAGIVLAPLLGFANALFILAAMGGIPLVLIAISRADS